MDKASKLSRLNEIRDTILWCKTLPTTEDLAQAPELFTKGGQYVDLDTFGDAYPSDGDLEEAIHAIHGNACGTYLCVAGWFFYNKYYDPYYDPTAKGFSENKFTYILCREAPHGIQNYLIHYLDIGTTEYYKLFGTARHGDLDERLAYIDLLIDDVQRTRGDNV